MIQYYKKIDYILFIILSLLTVIVLNINSITSRVLKIVLPLGAVVSLLVWIIRFWNKIEIKERRLSLGYFIFMTIMVIALLSAYLNELFVALSILLAVVAVATILPFVILTQNMWKSKNYFEIIINYIFLSSYSVFAVAAVIFSLSELPLTQFDWFMYTYFSFYGLTPETIPLLGYERVIIGILALWSVIIHVFIIGRWASTLSKEEKKKKVKNKR